MNNSLTSQSEETALRIDESNLNHHLWNNNGTWWIHYTIYPTQLLLNGYAVLLKQKILMKLEFCETRFWDKL